MPTVKHILLIGLLQLFKTILVQLVTVPNDDDTKSLILGKVSLEIRNRSVSQRIIHIFFFFFRKDFSHHLTLLHSNVPYELKWIICNDICHSKTISHFKIKASER